MTETPNNLDVAVATIVTPGDVTGLCKRITTWDAVVSWPGVQAAARGAVAGLRRLELAVEIAYNEQTIATNDLKRAEAEARIAAARAELAEIDASENPTP
jgi:hypothetical protein